MDGQCFEIGTLWVEIVRRFFLYLIFKAIFIRISKLEFYLCPGSCSMIDAM